MKKVDDIVNRKNVMLATVFTLTLLSLLLVVGMLTPLFFKMITGIEMILEASYFNERTAIPMLFLVFVLNICALLYLTDARKASLVPLVGIFISVISFFVSPFNSFILDVSIPFLLISLVSVIALLGYLMVNRLPSTSSGSQLNLRKIGAHIVHLGIILILIGVVISSTAKVEDSAEFSLNIEKYLDSQDYTIKVTQMNSYYEGMPYEGYPGSSYITDIQFDLYSGDRYIDTGEMKYITDFKWEQSYTTTYINRGFRNEIFIAPRAIDLTKEEISLYVRTVPYISLVWIGTFLLVLGSSVVLLIESKKGFKGNIKGRIDDEEESSN
ncbi:cytochrome c-type biogenesis CcmF C-terminal domain-containing protein [Methanosalsum natronophilum]|uniref:cytochrome c-type biogenesis CcmF C-terminal domain-containing protein n=1 Tax=Methanosalsum natronophilum TaxID=768733 RepID=UPI0021696E0F|nr:cytochrome c-type biogenesis CcmF C-terminal domain-containing protein [Methanosalsum natronophilum]MCS3924719.1 cytochrome c biogenesis factor [Methanosalsum natronophilum]